MVQNWGTEAALRKSAINKANHSCQQLCHTAGTKSFARLEDERGKRPSQTPLGRAEMFIITRSKKDGTPVNDVAAEKIQQMREHLEQLPDGSQDSTGRNDVFAQVMGPEHPGRIRGCGMGVTPTRLWGSISSSHPGASSNPAQAEWNIEMEHSLAERDAQFKAQYDAQQEHIRRLEAMLQMVIADRAPVDQASPVQETVASSHLSDMVRDPQA